eukprot:3916969-Rhodomonas_salina.1
MTLGVSGRGCSNSQASTPALELEPVRASQHDYVDSIEAHGFVRLDLAFRGADAHCRGELSSQEDWRGECEPPSRLTR